MKENVLVWVCGWVWCWFWGWWVCWFGVGGRVGVGGCGCLQMHFFESKDDLSYLSS